MTTTTKAIAERPSLIHQDSVVEGDHGLAAILKSSETSQTATGQTNFVMKLALIASMSGLLFGYDTGVVSGALIFLEPDLGLTDLQAEIVVSSTVLAAAISAFYGHNVMSLYGRKRTLVVASIVFVIGSLVMAVGNYEILVLGRIIVGVAIGFASEAGPLYISECAPKDMRGSLTTLFNVAVVSGQVFASIVCGLLSYLPPHYNWRFMMAFGALPALVQMMGFLTLPSSPTCLVLRGKEGKAKRVLREIRSFDGTQDNASIADSTTSDTENSTNNTTDPNDPIEQEFQEIIDERDASLQGHNVGLWNLWTTNPAVRRAMILGCSLWAVSQLAGINTIMYYGASIVRWTGLEGRDGSLSFDIWITVPLNAMQLFGILVCYCIIDTKGRRATLLISMTGVCAGLVLIGVGFAFESGVLCLFAMCLYLFCFGVGLSTMPYTMNAEIYPTEYRSICVAQATAVFWMTNFVVSLTFLTLANVLGTSGVFFLYAGIVVVSEVYFYFLVPETSGLSSSEVQALFQDKDSVDPDQKAVASTTSEEPDGSYVQLT